MEMMQRDIVEEYEGHVLHLKEEVGTLHTLCMFHGSILSWV